MALLSSFATCLLRSSLGSTPLSRQLSASAPSSWREIAIFIHGIDPEERPKEHSKSYNQLLNNVNKSLRQLQKPEFQDKNVVRIEWGWPSGEVDDKGEPYKDQALSDVQRKIVVDHIDPLYEAAPFDVTWNPAWRKMAKAGRRIFALGIGDLFYYCSKAGQRAVRDHVFGTVETALKPLASQPSEPISLTIFAHSAGTVIGHDLLYHIFRPRIKHEAEEKVCHESLIPARHLAEAGKLRVRRFFTFGSPITPLIVRSPELIRRFQAEPTQLLDPEDLGLRAVDQVPGKRWVNYWDKDDVISAPVAFFYSGDVILDEYVSVGNTPMSHTAYWESTDMASHIAKTF